MFGKSKSKSPGVTGAMHPVLARAQDTSSSGEHQLSTLTEKELQEKIKENKKKQKEKEKTVKKMESDQTFSPVQGILGVAIAMGIGWWAVKQVTSGNGVIDMAQYDIGRIITVVSLYLLVVITAFKMSFPQGFLCIVFPPYLLFFVAIPMEGSALKGLILGFLVVGYLEYRELGDNSCYAIAEKQYTALTAKGRGLLNAGSDKKFY